MMPTLIPIFIPRNLSCLICILANSPLIAMPASPVTLSQNHLTTMRIANRLFVGCPNRHRIMGSVKYRTVINKPLLFPRRHPQPPALSMMSPLIITVTSRPITGTRISNPLENIATHHTTADILR